MELEGNTLMPKIEYSKPVTPIGFGREDFAVETFRVLSSLGYYPTAVDGGTTGVLLNTILGVGTLTDFQALFYEKSSALPVYKTQVYPRIIINGTVFSITINQFGTVSGDRVDSQTPITFFTYDDTKRWYGLFFRFPIHFTKSLKIEVKNVAAVGHILNIEAVIGYELVT